MEQIVALRGEIKRIKQEDRVRQQDVYTTLINSLTAENAVPRTLFDKKPVHFKYPQKESSKLDDYKVQQHRFFMSSPQVIKNKKKRKSNKSNDASKYVDECDDCLDVPHVTSPKDAGNSAYFEKVRKKNLARLRQLSEIEHKARGFYDMVDDFIRNDQRRLRPLPATVRPADTAADDDDTTKEEDA